MVVSAQEWVEKYREGVQGAADRYVRGALTRGSFLAPVPDAAQKLLQYAQIFSNAHAAAAYIPNPQTDADRHRNVQLSWDTTRAVVAQYRGRAGTVAAAVPITV